MSFNQRRASVGGRGVLGAGRGRGGASYKLPAESRFRGGSTSSTGSNSLFEPRDPVAPIYVNPNKSRSEQLEQLKKERPTAKYNVLLPFRRAKLFCPRSYQQSLYTPTLVLVQELLSLAEASCSTPMTDEELAQEKGSGNRDNENTGLNLIHLSTFLRLNLPNTIFLAPSRPALKQPTKYFLDD